MSHIVEIQTEIRDPVALARACRRLKLEPPVHQTAKLFSGEVTGHCVRLPGWRYPLVVDVDRGSLSFDIYEGRWGDRAELVRLLQSYAVEKTRLEAARAGHTVMETPLADGSVKLTINAGAVNS